MLPTAVSEHPFSEKKMRSKKKKKYSDGSNLLAWKVSLAPFEINLAVFITSTSSSSSFQIFPPSDVCLTADGSPTKVHTSGERTRVWIFQISSAFHHNVGSTRVHVAGIPALPEAIWHPKLQIKVRKKFCEKAWILPNHNWIATEFLVAG